MKPELRVTPQLYRQAMRRFVLVTERYRITNENDAAAYDALSDGNKVLIDHQVAAMKRGLSTHNSHVGNVTALEILAAIGRLWEEQPSAGCLT